MKHVFKQLLIIAFGAACLHAAPVPVKPAALSAQEQKGAQYIAGVMLLSRTVGLADDYRAAWYRRLEKITGFTAASYKTFQLRYADDPASWERIVSEAQKSLSRP